VIRFILFILIVFIVYNLAKFFLRAITGSGETSGKMPNEPKSKYDDVEEAKFKDIDNDSQKTDKT